MATEITVTPEQFTQALDLLGVHIIEWGSPPRRDAGGLLSAIKQREASLSIDAEGVTVKIQSARAIIKNGKGEVLAVGPKNRRGIDNSDLSFANYPGGKMSHDEEPIETLRRELLEEIKLSAEDYRIIGCRTEPGSSCIPALPNISVRRTEHFFIACLRADHPYLGLETFEGDEHGQTLIARWMPEEELQARRQKFQRQFERTIPN